MRSGWICLRVLLHMDGDLLKMIFNVPGHIEMIRNGLFWYDGIDKPDYSAKAMKEFRMHRAQFLADKDVSKEVKKGLHPIIIKTQTRRLKRGVYQVEAERKMSHKVGYAVQRKRGVKAEPDIRILFDKIWEETAKIGCPYFLGFCISQKDAWAEGGYTRDQYEHLFRELDPNFRGRKRWAFAFHVIEVRRNVPGITSHAREERVERTFYPEQTAGYPRL